MPRPSTSANPVSPPDNRLTSSTSPITMDANRQCSRCDNEGRVDFLRLANLINSLRRDNDKH
eukprot:1463586-Amphidinium_carterae.1